MRDILWIMVWIGVLLIIIPILAYTGIQINNWLISLELDRTAVVIVILFIFGLVSALAGALGLFLTERNEGKK